MFASPRVQSIHNPHSIRRQQHEITALTSCIKEAISSVSTISTVSSSSPSVQLRRIEGDDDILYCHHQQMQQDGISNFSISPHNHQELQHQSNNYQGTNQELCEDRFSSSPSSRVSSLYSVSPDK